jgi:hypothetical protein
VTVLGVSAVLSTLDIVYDRCLSVRPLLFAMFFAFNLFATVNLMLPILWKVGNTPALYLSAVVALAGFASFRLRAGGTGRRADWRMILVAGALLLALVEVGRPFIPPAPLQLRSAEFGHGIFRTHLRIVSPMSGMPADWSGRVYALVAITAPMGLEEKVGYSWYLDGELLHESTFFTIIGGRREGYRLWTSVAVRRVRPGARLRLDLETRGGQLIGRAELPASS